VATTAGARAQRGQTRVESDRWRRKRGCTGRAAEQGRGGTARAEKETAEVGEQGAQRQAARRCARQGKRARREADADERASKASTQRCKICSGARRGPKGRGAARERGKLTRCVGGRATSGRAGARGEGGQELREGDARGRAGAGGVLKSGKRAQQRAEMRVRGGGGTQAARLRRRAASRRNAGPPAAARALMLTQAPRLCAADQTTEIDLAQYSQVVVLATVAACRSAAAAAPFEAARGV
jgi:hypothetical protein